MEEINKSNFLILLGWIILIPCYLIGTYLAGVLVSILWALEDFQLVSDLNNKLGFSGYYIQGSFFIISKAFFSTSIAIWLSTRLIWKSKKIAFLILLCLAILSISYQYYTMYNLSKVAHERNLNVPQYNIEYLIKDIIMFLGVAIGFYASYITLKEKKIIVLPEE